MERIDNFFEKINGSYFAFLTLICANLGILIGIILYTMVDPSYSLLSNFISDLSIGPNGSNIAYSITMFIMSLPLIPFQLYLVRFLQRRDSNILISWIALIFALISTSSIFLIGLFPMDPAQPLIYQIHIVLAVVLFGTGSIAYALYGYLELVNPEITKLPPLVSFITAIFLGLFCLSFSIETLMNLNYSVFTYLIEWTALGGFSVWLLTHGVYTLRNK